MAGYIGNIPVPQGTQTRQNFTATASQTSFPTIGYTTGFIDVYLNGVKLINGTDFTATNGSDVVLTTAASASDVLDVVIFDTFTSSNGTFNDATLKNNATLKNDTHEDSDGGRASKIIYQGEQSGGEISTLAEIQASHDGTADDQKGDLIFKTNDGSDNAAPTERIRIDSNGAVTATSTDQDGFFFKSSHATNTNFYVMNTNATTSNTSSIFLAPANSVAGVGLTALAIEDFSTSANRTADLLVKTRKDGTLAETWRFTNDGHLKAATNGNGIDFSATEGSGASSSILDDYEEGTWTPTGSSNVGAISNAEGFYTKIGNLVKVLFYATIDPNSDSSPVVLDGLPFTAANKLSITSIEGSGIAWSDSIFYVVSSGGGTTVNIELDRPIQGTASGSSHNFRCDFSYFA